MARLTVTVEGEAEEVRGALLRLVSGDADGWPVRSSGSSLGPQSASEDESPTSPEPPLPWTKEELAQLWGYLTHPARRVLREVAEQPDGYPFKELEQALGTTMSSIGGNLSSVGHAMRRLYRIGESYTKPWPISGVTHKREYQMDESVAASIRELAAQSAEEKGER